MALIALPTKFGFSRVERFGLTRRSNSLRSRYTGQGQTVVYPYAVWEFEGTLIEYDGPEAAAIRTFLVDLEGPKNTFKLPVPGYKKVLGAQGTIWTNGATAARATSLPVTKGGPGAVVGFNVGDFVTIQDELKIITAGMAFDANGFGVINFKPALRKPVPAGNYVIEHLNPYCLMRATEDDVASWSIAAPVRQSSNFEAIEAVDI